MPEYYYGSRNFDGAVFAGYAGTKGARALPERLDLRRHSPTGFEWGYGGSGPAQLALAILAHHAGDLVALDHYQAFKRDFICSLPRDTWRIEANSIDYWLAQQPTDVVRP